MVVQPCSFFYPRNWRTGVWDQEAKLRWKPERPQDLIGEFILHGSVSDWSDRGTGPLALLQS